MVNSKTIACRQEGNELKEVWRIWFSDNVFSFSLFFFSVFHIIPSKAAGICRLLCRWVEGNTCPSYVSGTRQKWLVADYLPAASNEGHTT